MDELNEEELKGVEGGACKGGSDNTIVLDSKAYCMMWLRAGKNVNQIWIRSITFDGRRLETLGRWNPFGRSNLIRYLSDGKHGDIGFIQYRPNGIIRFKTYSKWVDSIQLCYNLKGDIINTT